MTEASSCEFVEFIHKKDVLEIIDNFNKQNDDGMQEFYCERIKYFLDYYQLQPHLLDPHLEFFLQKLLGNIRTLREHGADGVADTAQNRELHFMFHVIYMFVKTRGFKVVIRYMPHEVSDLVSTLQLLTAQRLDNSEAWTTRYVILLWLSIVCMIPFDMFRLDTPGEEPVMDQLLRTAQLHMSVKDKSSDAACFLLARLLTRPDVVKSRLTVVLNEIIASVKSSELGALGALEPLLGRLGCLARLFKVGARADVVPHAGAVLAALEALVAQMDGELGVNNCANVLVKKGLTKLVQRVGTALLPARVAAWRYQRGSRSLATNLGSGGAAGAVDGEQQEASQPSAAATVDGDVTERHNDGDDDADMEISEEAEDMVARVIDILLGNLRDKDTIVRWSAAKGVGRLCGRLSRDAADAVVSAVLALCSRLEPHTAWHGACLALAELARLGLLLPHRLASEEAKEQEATGGTERAGDDSAAGDATMHDSGAAASPGVIEALHGALFYAQRQTSSELGDNVRDAACYVAWALARAFTPADLAPHVGVVARSLVLVALFDREIHVRRAAAAAFQENVGRQGQFPHGIDILAECDYFAVGHRTNCYLELSVFVAQFPEYVRPIVDHLVESKVYHWDVKLRELAASALNRLTKFDKDYIVKKVVPSMVHDCLSSDLAVRHGAVLTIGEIVLALKCCDDIPSKVLDKFETLSNELEQKKYYRGLGGELMRKAMCLFVQKCSQSQIPFHGKPVIASWQHLIDDCLEHKEDSVRDTAVETIPSFFTEFYRCKTTDEADEAIRADIIRRYVALCGRQHAASETNPCYRLGGLGALGALPAFFLAGGATAGAGATTVATGDERGAAAPIDNAGGSRSYLDRVLRALRAYVPVRSADDKNAEIRRAAVIAINRVCCTVRVAGDPTAPLPLTTLSRQAVLDVFDILFIAINDYTIGHRGDVGAEVREATISALTELSQLVLNSTVEIPAEIWLKCLNLVLQQSVEKIDRTRGLAAASFVRLLNAKPPIPQMPHRESIEALFHTDEVEQVNWTAAKETYAVLVKLLEYPEYRYHLLLGLIPSIGGLTESTLKYSTEAVSTFFQEQRDCPAFFVDVVRHLIAITERHITDDRLTVPLLKTYDVLLHEDVIYDYFQAHVDQILLVCNMVRQAITPRLDLPTLMAGLDFYCDLLQFDNVRHTAILQIMLLLCHRYPVIRRTAATKFYEALLMFGDAVCGADRMDELMSALTEVTWEDPVPQVREARNKICDLLGIKRPKMKVSPSAVSATNKL